MSENLLLFAGKMKARASAKEKAAYRQFSFEALSAGWSVERIADLLKVSPRIIRREVNQALDERRLDAPERYVKLQVSRLTEAFREPRFRGDDKVVAKHEFVKMLEWCNVAEKDTQPIGIVESPTELPRVA